MRTKLTTLVIIFCISLFHLVNAQSPDFEWVQNHGWIGGIGGFGKITTDEEGNILMANDFASSSINFGNVNLTNYSWNDNSTICVVKYDSTGNVLWAKTATGYFNYIKPKCIETDSNGDIYVTGLFDGDSIMFDQVTLKTPFVFGLQENMFVIKFSKNGTALWGMSASSDALGNCEGTGITIDADDNAIVVGNFSSNNIIFENDTIFNANNFFIAGEDIFLIKFGNNGDIIWTKGFGGLNDDEVNSVCSIGNNVYLTGYFNSNEIAFDSIVLTNQDSITDYNSNLFITKLSSTGNVIWARSNSTDGKSEGYSIDSRTDDLLYISGEFGSDTIIFGSDTLTRYASNKMFFCAFDTLGVPIWAKTSDLNSDGTITDISADSNGNLFLIGRYSCYRIKFDSVILYNNYESSFDVFIVKYDSAGNCIWAKSIGGNNEDSGMGITNFNGIPYITITFWSPTLHLGDLIVNAHSGFYSYDDILVAKLSGICTGNTIIDQTGNQFKIEGETATFSVNATGSLFINYQWYWDGYPVSGANSSTYTTPELTSSYNGSTYYCIVSNCNYSNSCTSITDTLTVCKGATATITVSNSELAEGDTAVFFAYAFGTPPFNYQWYKNGTVILGADSSIYVTPVLSVPDSGNIYYCTVTNCENQRIVQSNSIIISVSLGVDEISNVNDGIKIYPNPTDGEVTIEINQINNEYKISILNIYGQALLQCKLDRRVTQIDIGKLKDGIYIFKVESDKIERVRIIKK